MFEQQLVSNRHGVIESYQYQQLTRALEARQWSAPLLKAISDHPDTTAVEYESFVMALTADSVDAAADFDAAIERCVNLLGDADSTGAVAGQIAGAMYGYRAIHERLRAHLHLWDDGQIALRAALLVTRTRTRDV